MNIIQKYKWLIVAITAALVLLLVGLLCCGAKQKFYELNCIYVDAYSHYDFIFKDENTALQMKHNFPVNTQKLGTPVVCEDVKEYVADSDDTLRILKKRNDIAAAFINNPSAGINYQVEYMTLGGDVVGYSCLYKQVRYNCFTDEPFESCPETQDEAKRELASRCESKEIK
ncbi:MAG: hypothetical protein LBF37_02970 [Rickettsiales bacterium]|jgi:hypothetical protein|nr:hypothetical protein [Rickettsiales bacterium]